MGDAVIKVGMAQDPLDIAALASEVAGPSFEDKRSSARLKLLVQQLGKDREADSYEMFHSLLKDGHVSLSAANTIEGSKRALA